MKICTISDTHTHHEMLSPLLLDPDYVNDIDILIVAGDSSDHIVPEINYHQQMDFLTWLETIDIDHKIVVGGNHDTAIWKGLIEWTEFKTITYIEHELITVGVGDREVNIFGSPYTTKFGREGWAWNVKENRMDAVWKSIPDIADIVVTHMPAKGIRDLTERGGKLYEQVGCKALRNHLHRVKPLVHICGHVHDEKDVFNNGVTYMWSTQFVNASICNLRQTQFNDPIIIEI